jgi:hypothetical protein
MARYVTQQRVSTSWDAAVRFAHREGTPIQAIRCSPNVELVHRTDWWAWWSDGQMTVAIGLPDELRPQELSPDAVNLIDGVWFSHSPAPRCGWELLAQVQQILKIKRLSKIASRNDFFSSILERIVVKFSDEQQVVLYRLWLSDTDGRGYLCDLRVASSTQLNFHRRFLRR